MSDAQPADASNIMNVECIQASGTECSNSVALPEQKPLTFYPVPEPAASPGSHMPMLLRIVKAILSAIPRRFRATAYAFCVNHSFLLTPIYYNIFRLPFGLVLKRSYRPVGNEGHALRFANSIPGLQVPGFVDSVSTPEESYVISTWIEGDCVGDVWDDLTPADKSHIVRDLADQFSRMRLHTGSLNTRVICNAAGKPICDHRIPWVEREGPRIFTSCEEFAKEVWTGLDWPSNRDTLAPLLRPLIERKHVPIVFSHGDLIPRNLIFTGGIQSWRAGRTRIAIIDWEYAGWMPDYWETLKATWLDFEPGMEWSTMVRRIFPEHLKELDADWEWRSRSSVLIL